MSPMRHQIIVTTITEVGTEEEMHALLGELLQAGWKRSELERLLKDKIVAIESPRDASGIGLKSTVELRHEEDIQ